MQKILYLCTCFTICALQACSQNNDMLNLSDYQWENRLILVFSPSEDNKQYMNLVQQMNQDQAKLDDREIKVFHFLENGQSFVGDQSISKEVEQTIRGRYRIQEGKNTLMLIGKDGGEKDRQVADQIDLESFYPLIDSMPMRRREMREKEGGK